jgi:hypothetical protein
VTGRFGFGTLWSSQLKAGRWTEENGLESNSLHHPSEVNDLVHLFQRLEALADQAAVHWKKSEYTLSQIRGFLKYYPEGPHSTEFIPSQASAFSELNAILPPARADHGKCSAYLDAEDYPEFEQLHRRPAPRNLHSHL